MTEAINRPAGAVRKACVLRIHYLAGDQAGVRWTLDEIATLEQAHDVIAALITLTGAPDETLPGLAAEAMIREMGL